MQPVYASAPNIARAYDHMLGGKDHFAADRALAGQILRAYPLTAELLKESRAFLAGAVGYVARRGVSQFIELGSGLPTPPNVHETARGADAGARVVYVDNDPAVIAHTRGLLRATGGVRVMPGDLSEPEALLASPELAAVVDLGEPACLILTMVLHFLEPGTARAVAGVLTRRLAPGSYVIVSGAVPAAAAPASRDTAARGAARSAIHGREHTPAEIASFLGGLDLVEPGLVDARAWPAGAPAQPLPERAAYVLCGVGYKTPVPLAPADPLEDEHRDLARGLLLVLRVRRIRGDRPLPPLRALVAGHLARDHLPPLRAILELDPRVRAEVVVPEGMRRRAALRRHGRIAPIVLHPHHRRLAHLAAARAAIRDDHHRQAGIAQRRSPRPARALVLPDLVANPRLRARLVLTVNSHTGSQHQRAARRHAARDRGDMSPLALPTMYFVYGRRRICTRPAMTRLGMRYMVRSPSTTKNQSITSGS